MSVELTGLRVPLDRFVLQADLVLNARMTALFGASGAGKTTLLETIAGLRRPAAGRISLAGKVLTDVPAGIFVPPEQRAIGYLPQEGALFPHLNVRRNLLYAGNTHRPRPPGLTLDHVAAVLEISALLERRPRTLSGGERQRVALGRALLSAPRLLLLDEPLAGLDLPLRERLIPYLARVRDEFAIPIVFVTHSADEVVALCAEAAVLVDGRIERHGRTEDLFVPTTSRRYELGGNSAVAREPSPPLVGPT